MASNSMQELEARILQLNSDRTRLIQEWAAAEQLRSRVDDLQHHFDKAREVVDGAGMLLHATALAMGYPDPGPEPGVLASLESLADRARRLQDGNQRLTAELAAVTQHRDQLAADLLAVHTSRSWRLGRALTWPVRVLTGRGRRATR
jgi:hypothetical protein